MGLLQSPALPLGYPATGKTLSIHVDRRGDNGNLATTGKGPFGLIQRVHNPVLERYLQRADGNLYIDGVGIISRSALNDYSLGPFWSAGYLTIVCP